MIILIGFPKSGTSSFQKLFEMLGYNSAHFTYNNELIAKIIQRNKKNGRKLLSGLNVDCITQLDVCVTRKNNYWPQITDYKRLYNENKDAIFILNKRNVNELLDSFKRWNKIGLDTKFYNFNPELFKNIPGSTRDEKVINLFKKHYRRIEKFFASKPNAKFISFDINNDPITKLSKYIDIKNIKEFPHENINKKVPSKSN